MYILAVAQDFGFGPISMLNRAVSNLPGSVHVDYCISRHLCPVLDNRRNATIKDFLTKDELSKRTLDSYDAAIIACDYPLADTLLKYINKIIVYDMLFWFWPQIHDVTKEDILVIAQNFIGVEDRAKKYFSVRVVGPLLPKTFFSPFSKNNRRGILINLGGFSSPHHSLREANIYLSLLYPVLHKLHETGHDLCICGGGIILDRIIETNRALAHCCQKLKHSEMLNRISNSVLFVTVPGLGSIYESFFSGTFTYFLPPTNYTQNLQLENILSHVSSSLSCFNHNKGYRDNINTESEQSYITSLFNYYDTHVEMITDALVEDVGRFPSAIHEASCDVRFDTTRFIKKMGGPGEDQAIEYALEYLNT